MPNLPFRSLAGYLIRNTLGLAACCMLAVFVVQVGVMLHHHKAHFQHLADEVAKTSGPLLSVSLWDIEPHAVQQQVDLIADRPEVGYALLQVGTGQQFEAGDIELRTQPGSLRIPIAAPQDGKVIGELRIWANPEFVVNEVWRTAWSVLVGYGLFTVLICSLIAYMLRRDLQQPLQHLAQFARELTPQTLVRPLRMDRPRRTRTDEIDLVADGFSKLQNGLREHIANLDLIVAERTQQLEALAEANHQLSITDALTGCFNRRHLEDRLHRELERARRYMRPFSVICMDLDFFKYINDQYGHSGGDAVLCATADRLRSVSRNQVDWVVRLGGEEFLIVLPETDEAAAWQTAERLRHLLQSEPVRYEGHSIAIAASFGVAQAQPDEDGTSLIGRADELLYQAKAAGRNRVFPPL
jgi:two-component system cell cycle response regulator